MRFAAAAMVLVGAALASCDGGPKLHFNAVDVTGSPIGGPLELADASGKPRKLADFRGKVVIVDFGYTQCPDVCPTTLADINSALKKLGPDASRVQVLFVTVDPKRDKPELLREYLAAFNPDFIGLWGDEAATRKAENDFKVYAQERPGRTPGTYTVDHSAQSFVFDREGRIRLVIGNGARPDAMAADLKQLLDAPA